MALKSSLQGAVIRKYFANILYSATAKLQNSRYASLTPSTVD